MTDSATLFAENEMRRRPDEATAVRKIIRALKKAGNPVIRVQYEANPGAGEYADTPTEKAVMVEVFNLDEAWLITKDGDWVFLVMGEDPTEMPTDYSLSLDGILGGGL
jgi:hypothetical protein